MKSVEISVSIGEVFDKITILEIKSREIPSEYLAIEKELTDLKSKAIFFQGASQLIEELKKTNEYLWELEDLIREKEKSKVFDQEFVDIARNVYKTNDKRCSIKKEIDVFFGSEIKEFKSYGL
jgi:hypothetical protein